MANHELEHGGDNERPVKVLNCWNLLRAVLLYLLDLMLVVILLPRGSQVTHRNICLIFGKFGVHVGMLSVTYALYLAIVSNANMQPHGPISLGINRILGLPMDPNCRNRRGLDDSWSLLCISNNATLQTTPPTFVNDSAPEIDAPILDAGLTEAYLTSLPPTDSKQDPLLSTTPSPQVNSTLETLGNLTTMAPDFINYTVVSPSPSTSVDKFETVDFQSSTAGPTTTSSASFSTPGLSSSEPAANLTQPLVKNLPTSNLTSSVHQPGLNSSSQTEEDKLIDNEVYELLDKVMGCLAFLLMIFVMSLATCFAALALVKWGEERYKRKAKRAISLPTRPRQQMIPSRESAFEPPTSAVFRPIATTSFAPIQPLEESSL